MGAGEWVQANRSGSFSGHVCPMPQQRKKKSHLFFSRGLIQRSVIPKHSFLILQDKVSAVILSDTSQFKFYFKTKASLLSKQILVSTQENILKSSRKLLLILHRLGFNGLAHMLLQQFKKTIYLPPPSRIISEYSAKLIQSLQREVALFQKKSFIILSSILKRIIMFENFICLIYLLNTPAPAWSTVYLQNC